MRISRMQKKHIPQVIEVLTATFSDWFLKRRGRSRSRKRKPECFYPYLDIESDGCFIALERTQVIGAIFTHVWGKFGWIGTFGVHPDFQEKGIGKELMLRAIEYLDKKKNVTSLCLETMPDSSSNIGLYSKLGFKPAFLTIRLNKPNTVTTKKTVAMKEFAEAHDLEVAYFSQEESKEDAFTRMNWLSSNIINGLNHKSEIIIGDEYNFGETILLKREGFIIGYAVCRTFVRSDNDQSEPYLEIKNLVIDKNIKNPKILDYLLYICEQYGEEHGKVGVRLSINSSYWLAYQYLINKCGFNIRSAILRMVKFSEDIKSYDHHNEWIVICNYLIM